MRSPFPDDDHYLLFTLVFTVIFQLAFFSIAYTFKFDKVCVLDAGLTK